MSITRDPRDVPYSMFSHLQAMQHEEGKAPPSDFDAYFEEWLDFGFFFTFMKSFWPHVQEPNVMLLRYEDLQRDIRSEAVSILEFLGWSCTSDELDRILPLVDFARLRSKEKSEIFSNQKHWKKDAHFFREGGVGKNRARLSAEQERRIVERTRFELEDECADFVLSLGDISSQDGS